MRRSCVLLFCFVLLFVAGCGEDGPKLVPVEGTVTWNGKPLAGAFVRFQPVDLSGAPSYGETDEDGHYVLKFTQKRDGAMPGMHTVSIETKNKLTKTAELLPPEYNEKSTLQREVKDEKSTVINFDLPIKK